MCSCSGAFALNDVPIEDVYKSWVNTVNASGGIEGHPIQLIVEDDAGDPGTSVSDIQTLIGDHVDAIADASIADDTWASTIEAAKIPVVGIGLAEIPFYSNPDFYPEGQTNDSATYANVATAKASGATSLGDLYCAEAASCAQGVPAIKAAGKKLGVPVTYNGEISATAPNYTAQCLAAKEGKVKSLFIGDAAVIIARVAQDCQTQGYTPIYITEGLGFAPVLSTSPAIKDNLWSEYNDLPFWDSSSPAVQAMDQAVDKYYPGLRSESTAWNELAAMAWPSGLLLEDAVKAGGLKTGGTPTPAEIVQGLESLHGDTLDGWSPPLTFPAGQPHPISCWYTGKVVDGVASLVGNGSLTCTHA